jgi:hypothetical protein
MNKPFSDLAMRQRFARITTPSRVAPFNKASWMGGHSHALTGMIGSLRANLRHFSHCIVIIGDLATDFASSFGAITRCNSLL